MSENLLVLFPVALAISLTLLGLGIYKVKQGAKSNQVPYPQATARQVLDRGYQWHTDRAIHRAIGFFPKDTCGIVWDPVKQEFEYPDTEWPDWMVIMAEHELMIDGHQDNCFQCRGGWKWKNSR